MTEYRACKRRGPHRKGVERLPTARLLRRIAKESLPFYKAVAFRNGYAEAWSRAVVAADLDWMRKQLRAVAPRLANHGMGTNGIGYFFSFAAPKSDYSAGITIPPGRVRFYFNPRVHRLIGRALLPYYREIVCRPLYASALARAIRRKDQGAAARLVQSRIRTQALKSVRIEDRGLVLSFKYPFSKFVYTYLMFQEFK